MISSAKASILIVEDKFIVAEDIANTLRKLGYAVPETVMSGEEAIERARALQPDLILMDIQLKGEMDGIRAAEAIKSEFGIPVIFLTAHSDDGTLQRASAADPSGYILKPYEERQLYTTVELALNRSRAERRRQAISVIPAHGGGNGKVSAARSLPEFQHIIGSHPLVITLLERVELVAKTDVAVHVFGENGTGKELIADAVHRLSTRKDKPFVKLNCSAIPATLLESALFGHLKGSFTGASRDQQGFIEHAHGGTLFLDEIGDISHDIQVKLLRLLQSREYTKVGDTAARKADLRIITATNRNLKELVKEGRIREDFFYRIHVFPLLVPALRDRASDIIPLAEHFRALFNQNFGKNLTGFTAEAKAALERHSWPGNIRELENAIRHAFVIAPSDGAISAEHFPPDIFERAIEPEERQDVPREIAANTGTDAAERESILKALVETGGSKTRAAKLLGYSRVTLWKKMSRLGIGKGGPDESEDEE